MNPLLKAEQAVLGAVLLDPDQLAHLDWLAPDHFYRPVHQALFAALRTLRSDGHPAIGAEGPVPLSWVTDAVDEAGRHVRGLTAVYPHLLISACPRPAHAPVYGRMVLEGAIHRTVAEHATRLHQAARADALRGEVEGALRSADVLTGVLTDLARRWGTEPRPVAPTTAPATGSAVPPPVRDDQVAEDERFLLAVLTEQPKAVAEVVDWLRPVDFADPAHGQLYRCLGALHHRGEPIDRITLLWEAQRRGLLADGTLSGEQVTALCDDVIPGSAEWFGERVMRSSLTRTAAASARAVRALAEDEALGPGRLINHALHALGPLDEVRARGPGAGRPRPQHAPPRQLAPGPDRSRPRTGQCPATLTRPPMTLSPLSHLPFCLMEFALIDTASSDALALRATASGFDAVRAKLPDTGDPDRPLDNVTIAFQLSHLGTLLTELADEVLHRAAERNRQGHTAPAIMGFAAAVRPACEAASALGAVACRLSARDQAGHLDDGAGADEYDQLVMGNALGIADEALRKTSEGLRAAAETVSPSSVRVKAARSRSPTAAPSVTPPASTVPSAAPPGRTARGR